VADFAPNAWGQVSGIATGTPTTALQSHRGRPIVPLRSSDGRTVALTALDAQGAPQVLETLSVPAGQAIDTVNITDGIAYSAGFDGRYRGFVQGIETHALDCRGGTIVQPIVARLRATEAPAVLFIDPSGTLRCIDGADGHERWSRTATGCYSYYMPNSRPHGIPVAVDIDGDGTLEVLVAERPNRLVALAPDGTVKRTWTLPGAPQMWTVGDFNGDGVWDLLVTYARGAVLDVATVVISGRSGKLLWSMQGGNGPSAVADVDGDGRDDILTRDLYERRIWRGSDGRDLQPIEIQAGYHTPVIPSSPYDGVLWLGGSWSALAEDRDGKRLWRHWLAPTGSGCAADVDGDGRLEVATVTAGNIYALPDLRPINGPNQEFLCHDARTGALRWSLPLNATTPGIVAGDVDGDGHPEFVFGTSDARLIALGGDGKIRWERNLPAALGVPVLADVAGDGKLEVLIPCADGHLYRFSADTPAPRRLSS
jgi:outer membrane protein assembly factor BamB